MERCPWAQSGNQLMQDYHDEEWGKPLFGDQQLFGLLSLELMQAGLSWQTVLNKRTDFNLAFENFSIQKVSQFDERKISELMENSKIIRNQRKISAIITNAQAIVKMNQSGQSFDTFLWQFVNNKPLNNLWNHAEEVPAETDISKQLSKELKKLGFKFVGSKICYSLMQSMGMVDDHLTSCAFKTK
ncbi:DNA-3-methyladenine glycosylase I [Dellaglioa algida]|uniref:DNA-3-methyladenine glycosylase I n=1 Tax=Dellaglioa algida TaxID=105612 RepID=A0A5C6M9N6_9LACO|nr:DNA-3-methyladenine glycosylase I [Dellaglioa algida]MDK1717438.1 DNA-3-methyladenine glycosylase I [Dellaglioa algida]MDK1720687.1 DNA-3-methyladenine glycosylase I [Dellaglioa algida]MDK1722380.1 DNA-3-methyladenine glycosylase I [Dellaglioa algida]MDK1724004.1 DNA-3-methyladenine glycosylase I [Dellaglioa algida]MDK1725561.1 DNA-3-methyladenine glycosylase I [Dellaglioa algida]